MDIFLEIIAGIILLPSFFWGLSMILDFMGLAGIGIFTAFSLVWDKKEKLNFKEGLAIGLGYMVIALLIGGLFLWLIGLRAMESSTFYHIIKSSYEFLGLGLLILAFIRQKVKFALGFMSSMFGIPILLELLIRYYN